MSKKLTLDFIALRTKNARLEQLTKINLWGNDFEDVSILSDIPALEVISLSVNKIKSLSCFEKLVNLKELHLRKNEISDLSELSHLKNLKQLRTLSILENPVCNIPNYKEKVIEMLPQITKLDNEIIDSKDHQIPKDNQPPKKHPEKETSKHLKKKDSMEDMSKDKNPFNNNIQNDIQQKDQEPSLGGVNKEKPKVKNRPYNENQKAKAKGDLDIKFKKSKNIANSNNNSFDNNSLNAETKAEENKGASTSDIFKRKKTSGGASYSKPLNKSINFDSYKTEGAKPQYKKKIVGNFNSGNSSYMTQASQTNRLAVSQLCSSRYDDNSEQKCQSSERKKKSFRNVILEERDHHESGDVKEPESNDNPVIQSIKLLLTTLDKDGLNEIKDEINNLLKE